MKGKKILALVLTGVLALGMTGVISMSWFGLAFGTFVVASFGLIKHVTNLQGIYDKKLRILSIYAKLIALIDRQEMKAPLLARLKAKFGTDGKRTSERSRNTFGGGRAVKEEK